MVTSHCNSWCDSIIFLDEKTEKEIDIKILPKMGDSCHMSMEVCELAEVVDILEKCWASTLNFERAGSKSNAHYKTRPVFFNIKPSFL